MNKELLRGSQLVGVLCLALVILCGPSAVAQEPAAAAAPEMVRVVTVHTHLGHSDAFEAGMKKLAALANKHGNQDLAFVGMLTSSPGSYDLVFPISSLNDIMKQEERGSAMWAEMGADMNKMFSAAQSVDEAVYRWRGDLSYQPESPRVPQGEAGFTRMITLRPHLQHAQAFEGVMKKASALRKKHGLNDGTSAWQKVLGANSPEYVVLIDAKDQADFYTHQAMAMKKMASDWQALMEESSGMLREIEYASSVPRPDLMASSE